MEESEDESGKEALDVEGGCGGPGNGRGYTDDNDDRGSG